MLEDIIKIALEAGDLVMKIRRRGFKSKTKRDAYDFVTSADIKSEELIISKLQELFPRDSILSEEKARVIGTNKDRIWMVDPLDGTKDFKNGGNGFSVMIGLCYKGQPHLGVVYAPAQEKLYYASLGGGAYLRVNGVDRRLHVSETSQISRAVMVTRIAAGEKRADDALIDSFKVREKVPESSVGLKLGLIAEGRADLYLSTQSRASKWDTCAPQIILREAGGVVTDRLGKPLDYTQKDNQWVSPIVASNGVLHKSVVRQISRFSRK